jgi:hypothetical protein
MTKILEFAVGTADRARLKLQVRGRERPDLTEADDSNWLQGAIDVRSGTMAGSVPCSLRTEDLVDFRTGLARMTDGQSATAECKTMEGLLAIRIVRCGRDELGVSGHISESVDGNRLTFRFTIPAAGIPLMLKDLDEILDEYPSN